MKILFSTLLCFVFLFSCAQKEIKKEEIMNQENVKKVVNIYKKVKTYNYNPSYTLNIDKATNFTFEALVNDLPVYKQYDPGNLSGLTRINQALLKFGKQKLTIRMTPVVDNNYNMAKEIDMENVVLKLSINYGEYGKEKVKDFKEALKYELPKQKGRLPYYEVNLEFDAPVVAYEKDIEGWKNGIDLSKENKDELLKEVEAFYKEMIGYYKAKDVNAIAGKYYKRQFEITQADYQNEWFGTPIVHDPQKVVNEWIDNVNDSKPFIFNQYKMQFLGDGKMVALVKVDKYYIDYSALMREDPESGKAVWYDMYLYRPKAGAPLEVIR